MEMKPTYHCLCTLAWISPLGLIHVPPVGNRPWYAISSTATIKSIPAFWCWAVRICWWICSNNWNICVHMSYIRLGLNVWCEMITVRLIWVALVKCWSINVSTRYVECRRQQWSFPVSNQNWSFWAPLKFINAIIAYRIMLMMFFPYLACSPKIGLVFHCIRQIFDFAGQIQWSSIIEAVVCIRQIVGNCTFSKCCTQYTICIWISCKANTRANQWVRVYPNSRA